MPLVNASSAQRVILRMMRRERYRGSQLNRRAAEQLSFVVHQSAMFGIAAKSIDDTEHGARMETAIVRQQDLGSKVATFRPENRGTYADRSLFASSSALFRRISSSGSV